MSNRVAIVSFGYSKKIVVPADVALKIAELLDGYPMVNDTYHDGGMLWYQTGDEFNTELEVLALDNRVHSHAEYEAIEAEKEAQYEAQRAAEESNAA